MVARQAQTLIQSAKQVNSTDAAHNFIDALVRRVAGPEVATVLDELGISSRTVTQTAETLATAARRTRRNFRRRL